MAAAQSVFWEHSHWRKNKALKIDATQMGKHVLGSPTVKCPLQLMPLNCLWGTTGKMEWLSLPQELGSDDCAPPVSPGLAPSQVAAISLFMRLLSSLLSCLPPLFSCPHKGMGLSGRKLGAMSYDCALSRDHARTPCCCCCCASGAKAMLKLPTATSTSSGSLDPVWTSLASVVCTTGTYDFVT